MKNFLATRRYPALLALIAASILGFGVLLKPGEVKSASPVSEYETQRLQQLAQKKALEDMSALFARAAAGVESSLLFVRETGATAVLWETHLALMPVPTNSQGDGGALHLLGPGGSEYKGRSVHAAAPVAALRLENVGGRLAPASKMRALPKPGAWLLQVSRETGGILFTPGTYRGVRPLQCGETQYREIDTSIGMSDRINGGGIYDLDGRLLAVIGRCGVYQAAFAVPDLLPIITAKPNAAEVLQKEWGAKLEPVQEHEAAAVRVATGLFVREVRDESRAARIGLEPGDVVVSVNNNPVGSIADLPVLALTNDDAHLTVVRRHRKRTLSLPPATNATNPEPLLGAIISTPPAGILIERVLPGTLAARAGIKSGDRLLQVDGTRLTRPGDAARLTKGATPRLLMVRRGESKIAAVVR